MSFFRWEGQGSDEGTVQPNQQSRDNLLSRRESMPLISSAPSSYLASSTEVLTFAAPTLAHYPSYTSSPASIAFLLLSVRVRRRDV
jgi:hypothetical protein